MRRAFFSLGILMVGIALSMLFFWRSDVPDASCSDKSSLAESHSLFAPKLSGTAAISPIIVLATDQKANDHLVTAKVTQILKGSGLKRGDIIMLCPFSASGAKNKGDTLLLFLKGKDKKDNYWVTSFKGDIATNEAGKFLIGTSEREASTLEEIKQAIKENK